jgi:hypothetical protein
MNILLPILSIKWFKTELGHSIAIQTTNIDIEPVWVRSGTIKCVNSTGSAKQVLGDTCVERIGCEGVGSGQQGEAIGRHNQVQESFFAAN